MSRRGPACDLAGRWPTGRETFAIIIGLAAALSATTPLNSVNTRLDLTDRPWLVVASPVTIVAILAIVAAITFRAADHVRLPRGVTVGCGLLAAAGVVSSAASAHPSHSAMLFVTCLLAPGLTLTAVWRSSLPRNLVCGAWLLGVVLLLIRADIVFLTMNGPPTPQSLFAAKYSNAPYDFHYYTLGNPNSTTAFLVLPLTLALVWARDPGHDLRVRRALIAVTWFLAANMVIVFTRTGIAVTVALAILTLLGRHWGRRWGVWILVGLIVVVALVNPTLHAYFSDVAQHGQGSSAQVRVSSIERGWNAIVHRPITGYGLGQRGIDAGFTPAHSAIVQAGAETGLLGAAGVVVIMATGAVLAFRVGRRDHWRGLAAAGVAAAALFSLLSAIAGSTNEWLGSDATSAWGLGLAIAFAAVSARPGTEVVSPQARAAMAQIGRPIVHAGQSSGRAVWEVWRSAWKPERQPWVLRGAAAALVFGVTAWVALSPEIEKRLLAKLPQYGPVLQQLPLRGPGPIFDVPIDRAAITRAASLIGTHSTYYIYESRKASPGLSDSLTAAGLLFFSPSLPVDHPEAAQWIFSYQANRIVPPDVKVGRSYAVGVGIYLVRAAS